MNGNFIRAEKRRYSNEEIPRPPVLDIQFFANPPYYSNPQLLIPEIFSEKKSPSFHWPQFWDAFRNFLSSSS